VSGENNRFIRERKNLLADAPEKQLGIAAGQIPSADSAAEEHVAANQQIVSSRIEAKAARAMSGHLEDIQLPAQEILRPPLTQSSVDLNGREPDGKALPDEKILLGNHGDGLGVAKHGTRMPRTNGGSIRDVIPMPVGKNEQSDPLIGEGFVRTFRGVEKHDSPRCLGGITVGFVWSPGETFELHGALEVEATGLIFLAQSVFQGNQI
jgi:hypothetical protein